MSRVHPFPVVHPVYEKPASVYPEKVKVSMDNGKVIDYRIETPVQKSVLKPLLDAFTRACFGGQKYKTKGPGKRTGRRTNERTNEEHI